MNEGRRKKEEGRRKRFTRCGYRTSTENGRRKKEEVYKMWIQNLN
jgi:hypothetical protein